MPNNAFEGYFNTSLSPEERQLIDYVYKRSYDISQEENTRFSNTFAQKVLTTVSDELDLPVTRGWFKLGRCSLMEPDDSRFMDIENPPNSIDKEELDDKIREVSREFQPSNYPNELRKKQYERHDKSDYLALLRLESSLNMINYLTRREKILEALDKFDSEFPEEGYTGEQCSEIVNFFCVISSDLIKHADNGDLEAFRRVVDTFEDLKELTSDSYMYETVEGPEKDQVRSYLSQKIRFDKSELEDSIRLLKSDFSEATSEVRQTISEAKEDSREEWITAKEEANGDLERAREIYDKNAKIAL